MAVVDWAKIALLALPVLAMTGPVATAGQSEQTDNVYRIGFLAFGPRPLGIAATTSPLVTFRQALRERGYVEGENLILDERWAAARLDRLPVLAAELVQLGPDIIVASGAGAVRAAMRATREIPIVIAGAAEPVAEGLVSSLAHPDANVTGVSMLSGRELEGKRLEFLQKAVPGITRVAVILDSTSRLDPTPIQIAARALGITLLLSGETESPEEFRDTFAEMVRDGADAVYAPETPVNVRHRRLIVELALEHRLPAIYASREYVEAGGLMSYGPNFSELFGRVAIYTDRILKGAAPGELPVERPMHFEFVVSRRAAKSIGLSLPASILIRADAVIQ
jgi:putative ABC transport system substrate-binding protein